MSEPEYKEVWDLSLNISTQPIVDSTPSYENVFQEMHLSECSLKKRSEAVNTSVPSCAFIGWYISGVIPWDVTIPSEVVQKCDLTSLQQGLWSTVITSTSCNSLDTFFEGTFVQINHVKGIHTIPYGLKTINFRTIGWHVDFSFFRALRKFLHRTEAVTRLILIMTSPWKSKPWSISHPSSSPSPLDQNRKSPGILYRVRNGSDSSTGRK